MTTIENRTFLFYDAETGEDFLVEAENLARAIAIAKDIFVEPVFIDTISNEYAELLGLDTY